MPISSYNRTLTQVAVAQGAAGSTDLVAAPGAGARIYVVRIVLSMSVAGTLKFTEGTGPTDLTGALDIAAAGGFVVGSGNGEPVLFTNTPNAKLSVVTTVGLAKGWLHYFIDA